MNAKRIHRKNYNDLGHAHELTFSCYRRLPLLTKDRTRNWLVASIDDARDQFDFDVWAYVIMPEHVHLIVHPRATLLGHAALCPRHPSFRQLPKQQPIIA